MDDEEYMLGGDTTEQARLLQQGKLLEQEARWLLYQVNVQAGWRAIDLGCGPLGILHLLSERVGASGEVIGVDRDERILNMARTLAAERNLTNVRLVQGDATATDLPRESFDFVHERLLLMITPHRDEELAEMVALPRPGGVVALQDFDVVSMFCEPPHPPHNNPWHTYPGGVHRNDAGYRGTLC
jgi:ubiquinone/menaquinone biosynthesis C-methylase UbiE